MQSEAAASNSPIPSGGKEPDCADRLLIRATALEHVGRWDAAAAIYDQLFAAGSEAGNLKWLLDALRGEAHARRFQERYEEAEEFTELRHYIAEQIGDLSEAAGAVHMLGTIRHCSGDLVGAELAYREATNRLRDIGADHQLGITFQNLGALASMQGRLPEARLLCLESLACAIRSGKRETVMAAYNNLALVCMARQDWLEAELYCTRGLEIAEQFGDPPMRTYLHANRAQSLIGIGELNQARDALTSAAATASVIGDRGTLSEVELHRGTIARLEGDLLTSELHLTQAATLAADAGLQREQGLALEGLAELRWQQNRPEAARLAAEESERRLTEAGAVQDRDRVEARLQTWARLPAPSNSITRSGAGEGLPA